jgi:sugar/nucleoside kinase (ribokinase family)
MQPRYVIAGQLRREFILPPFHRPIIDAPGGNALYAGAGARVWDTDIGLVSRVGEEYPQSWRKEFEVRGFDTSGIQIVPGSIDLRTFRAYSETFEISQSSPVSHFSRRKIDFPKALLGYKPIQESEADTQSPSEQSPAVNDIPDEYFEASAVHLGPLDLISHGQLLAAFKSGSATTLTLTPLSGYMTPKRVKEVGGLLNGLTAFLPSQHDLESLFWGKTNDLWEMAEELGRYSCEVIVIKCGGRGQLVYDVAGKKRWEVPAYPSRIADPTGAGDSFCGGFVAGYRTTYDALEATLYGNISASLNIEGSGAFNSLEVMPGLAQARLNVIKDLVRKV